MNEDIPAPKKVEDPTEDKFVPHFLPAIDINLLFDNMIYSKNSPMSPELMAHMKIVHGLYEPIIYLSDFWNLKKNMVALNSTLVSEIKELNLTLNFQNYKPFYF